MNIFENRIIQIILLPFSFFYGLIIRIRNLCYDFGLFSIKKIDGCKIISIGNISVGGTGKTPVVKYLADYLIKTPVQKLSLLPAGQPSSSPSELLGSRKMEALIQELKGRYPDRFIILDTPPAHFTAETSSLLSMMDGLLLVVRAGKTSRAPLEDVVANIDREKILGVVFNASAEVQRDYKYYYRYYQRGGSD